MNTLLRRPLVVSALLVLSLGLPGAGAAQTGVQKVQVLDAGALPPLDWRSLAEDGQGDGAQARLPDAKALSYAVDPSGDRLWWKIALHDEPPRDWFGINIVIDSDDDPANGTSWWGANSDFKFDRLVTAYLYRAEGYWQGVVGVADGAGAAESRLDNVSRDVAVALAPVERAVVVGIPRAVLASRAGPVRAVGAVGSTFMFNDDVPNQGAATAILAASP